MRDLKSIPDELGNTLELEITLKLNMGAAKLKEKKYRDTLELCNEVSVAVCVFFCHAYRIIIIFNCYSGLKSR